MWGFGSRVFMVRVYILRECEWLYVLHFRDLALGSTWLAYILRQCEWI